jgi:hypothetical protein
LASKLQHLLGNSDQEKVLINQWCLEALGKWKSDFVADRTKTIDALNAELKSKVFIATNYFSLADITLYSVLYNVPVLFLILTSY